MMFRRAKETDAQHKATEHYSAELKTNDDALEEEKTLTRNAVAEPQSSSSSSSSSSEKSKAEKAESDLEKTIQANEQLQHFLIIIIIIIIIILLL